MRRNGVNARVLAVCLIAASVLADPQSLWADHLRRGGAGRGRGGFFLEAWGPGGGLAVGDGVLVGLPWGLSWWDDPWYSPGWFCHRGPVVLPPLFVPPEAVYGNIFPWSQPVPATPQPPVPINEPALPPAEVDPAEEAEEAKPPRVRVANAATLARAWRFVRIGDDYFAQQRYLEAYRRYRDAAHAAPDLVEAWLRQGQALLAAGNYSLAATTYKRALKTAPAWFETAFRLDEIYGNQGLAKRAHLASVADAARRDPGNGDLLLLVALHLYLDGQEQRALLFFRRALDLLPREKLHLEQVAAQQPGRRAF